MAPGETRIQLCGPLVVRISGRRIEADLPGRQGRLLFAYLALHRDRAVEREELIGALWPEGAPSAPGMAMSALLSKIRSAAEEGLIDGRAALRMRLPKDARVDLETASDAVHEAESAIAAGDWWKVFWKASITEYAAKRGFLVGEESPWIDTERRALEEMRARALECIVRARMELGLETRLNFLTAARLIELAPYRESGYRLVMAMHESEGNCAEALRVYEGLRVRLRDELGATPSRETQELHGRLLRSEAPSP